MPSEAPSEVSVVGWNQSVLQVRWREPSPASLNGPFKSFRIHYQRVRSHPLQFLCFCCLSLYVSNFVVLTFVIDETMHCSLYVRVLYCSVYRALAHFLTDSDRD